MTPEHRREFESVWPGLESKLARYLRSRGLPQGRSDDIVQETALRLLGMWERLLPGAPLWPLARTIALNIVRDRARRWEPEPTGTLPERAASGDVEEAGLARIELRRVSDALEQLTPAQRNALLAEVGSARSSAPNASADKMLRLRARQKLTRLLQRSPLFAPLRWSRFSDAMHWLTGIREAATQSVSCIACVALGLGTIVLVPGGAAQVGDPRVAPAEAAITAIALPLGSAAGTEEIADPSHGASFHSASGRPRAERRSRSRQATPTTGGSGESAESFGPEDLPLPRTKPPDDVKTIVAPGSGPTDPGDGRESPVPFGPPPIDVRLAVGEPVPTVDL